MVLFRITENEPSKMHNVRRMFIVGHGLADLKYLWYLILSKRM